MHKRESYLNDDLLKEMAGRLKYGGVPLEQQIENLIAPEPKPWAYPDHPNDDVAAIYGMRGFEFVALQQAAMREMRDNEMLQQAYKKFLVIAKLVCEEQLEKVRQHERRISEDKNRRDRTYQDKKRQFDHKVQKMTDSWTAVRATINTRWLKLGRSLATKLEKDSSMITMADRDLAFVRELETRAIAFMNHEEARVREIDWDRYAALPIEDIYQVILMLDRLPSGNFIKKPVA